MKLRSKIAKLEDIGGEALQAALEAQRKTNSENEQMITSLRNQNEEKDLIIANLRLHIERLTNALNGNKSHFAKFVELKTENAMLHVGYCCRSD